LRRRQRRRKQQQQQCKHQQQCGSSSSNAAAERSHGVGEASNPLIRGGGKHQRDLADTCAKQMLRCVLLIVAAAACVVAAPLSHTMALFHPNSASMNAQCPHTYTVLFHTTKGDFEVQGLNRLGPYRLPAVLQPLQDNGFYNDVAFCRTVPNFMVQFGIPGKPKLASNWQGDLDY
jgi:hypothetical protein